VGVYAALVWHQACFLNHSGPAWAAFHFIHSRLLVGIFTLALMRHFFHQSLWDLCLSPRRINTVFCRRFLPLCSAFFVVENFGVTHESQHRLFAVGSRDFVCLSALI
jgi:hypothetical protein